MLRVLKPMEAKLSFLFSHHNQELGAPWNLLVVEPSLTPQPRFLNSYLVFRILNIFLPYFLYVLIYIVPK